MSFKYEMIIDQPRRVYSDLTCDGCGSELKPVFCGQEELSCLQALDVLHLKLEGGYGMAIDPMGDATEQELNILFCRECTIKLCKDWPAIAKTVMNHGSIGHHCKKAKEFVWTSDNCCDSYCSRCGELARKHSYQKDIYARPIVECKCGITAPCLFAEEGVVFWCVEYNVSPKSLEDEFYSYVNKQTRDRNKEKEIIKEIENGNREHGPFATFEAALSYMRDAANFLTGAHSFGIKSKLKVK